MKKILQMTVLAVLVVLGSSYRNSATAQYNDDYYDRGGDVSYQTFYDELSPYGQWVEYPGQGYVWVPDAGPDFQPYSSNGHWVWTDDYEWMWVSDYDWGWAPFHYGRWDHDDYYGWYWVPGYEWAPAWVDWRDGGDYYGWAPLRPGISLSINFNIGGYNPPFSFWVFAPRRYITSPRIYDYYVDRSRNYTIINQTTVIVNNYRYGGNYGFRSGPRRYDAEIYCGRISPVRFRQSYSPGRTFYRNNEISMYRPSVRQDNNRNIAPRRFERYDRNNGSIRNNQSNNNGFRRNDNNNFGRNDGNRNGRPDPRDRVRDDRNFRQPGNNGRNNDIGYRRNDNNGRANEDRFRNNGNPGRADDNRFRNNDNNGRPNRDINNGNPSNRGRTDRSTSPVPNRMPADRTFDRPNGRPDREPRTGGQPNMNNNRFEPRNNGNSGRSRDMRTNDNPAPRQPQMDRRVDTRPQSQPRVDRRPESRPQSQPQSQPSRQFERRNEGRDNGGNRGGGNGRGRRSE